jgi:hypothetical protein
MSCSRRWSKFIGRIAPTLLSLVHALLQKADYKSDARPDHRRFQTETGEAAALLKAESSGSIPDGATMESTTRQDLAGCAPVRQRRGSSYSVIDREMEIRPARAIVEQGITWPAAKKSSRA